jgi:VanZ family protein
VFSTRLRRTLSLALAIVLVLSLFGSAPSTGGLIPAPWDKLVHFGFFGCLTLLLAIAFGHRNVLFAFIAAVAVGIADEGYQAFLPTRHADWGDLLSDVFAAGCAALLARHFLSAALPELPVAGAHDPQPEQQVGHGVGQDGRP